MRNRCNVRALGQRRSGGIAASRHRLVSQRPCCQGRWHAPCADAWWEEAATLKGPETRSTRRACNVGRNPALELQLEEEPQAVRCQEVSPRGHPGRPGTARTNASNAGCLPWGQGRRPLMLPESTPPDHRWPVNCDSIACQQRAAHGTRRCSVAFDLKPHGQCALQREHALRVLHWIFHNVPATPGHVASTPGEGPSRSLLLGVPQALQTSTQRLRDIGSNTTSPLARTKPPLLKAPPRRGPSAPSPPKDCRRFDPASAARSL